VPQEADKQILACTGAGPLFVHRTFIDCSRLRVKLRRASTPFAVRTCQFKLCAHFLNLSSLLSELGFKRLDLFLQFLNFAIEHRLGLSGC
jgi:hypothetical protein